MRLAAMHGRAVGVDPLMRVDHRHAGRLADNDRARTRQILAETGDQRPHAGAADLLVIGDDEMHRLLQRAGFEQRHRGEHAGDKAFHVAAASGIELAAALRQRERITRPALALDRHAVAMAREPDAASALAAHCGEQIGLGAVGRGDARRGDAVAPEHALDEADQLEIRLGAGRVEADKRCQQLRRCFQRGCQGNSVSGYELRGGGAEALG